MIKTIPVTTPILWHVVTMHKLGCTGDDIDMNMEIGNWTFNSLILQNSKAPKV